MYGPEIRTCEGNKEATLIGLIQVDLMLSLQFD